MFGIEYWPDKSEKKKLLLFSKSDFFGNNNEDDDERATIRSVVLCQIYFICFSSKLVTWNRNSIGNSQPNFTYIFLYVNCSVLLQVCIFVLPSVFVIVCCWCSEKKEKRKKIRIYLMNAQITKKQWHHRRWKWL